MALLISFSSMACGGFCRWFPFGLCSWMVLLSVIVSFALESPVRFMDPVFFISSWFICVCSCEYSLSIVSRGSFSCFPQYASMYILLLFVGLYSVHAISFSWSSMFSTFVVFDVISSFTAMATPPPSLLVRQGSLEFCNLKFYDIGNRLIRKRLISPNSFHRLVKWTNICEFIQVRFDLNS